MISAMVSRKDEPVHFHESRDFDWEELRVRFEPMLRAQEEEAAAAETAPVQIHDVEKAHTEGQIEGWERHFRRHVDAPVPFFKERRALLEEFPLLKEPGIHILEVGSGNGSSVLPVLRHNVSATVHATDPSPTAVQDTRMRVEEAGFGDRLTTELQPASTVPCSAQHGPFDVVMIHCTLSAIPGDDDRALLVASAALLRPGGAVLIRDHGLYDMRHLKDMRRGASMVDHLRTAYLRPGGMHRRYYSLENLQELAAAASLQVEENRYLCIRQHNKKKGIHMDRVYVHAVFRNGHAVESDVKPTARIEQTLPARAHTSPSETSSSLSSRPTAAAYMTAIKSCGANGQAAVKILSEVTQALGTHDMFAVSTALAVCGKGGDWKTAVELFNSLPEPDQESCHAALSVLQQTGRGAEAEALLDRIHHLNLSLRNSGGRTDVAVDLRCLNIALKASQRMLHLARSARPPKDEEEAGAGGDGEEGEGGVGGAEALRQESAGGDVEQERCKGSVRQERCAVSRRALALGRRLLDSAEDRFGVCPNVESYAIVAESALVAGDFMQANALYDMATRLCASADATLPCQLRMLYNLEAHIWKCWSHRQLKLVLDAVASDASVPRPDSEAWHHLSSSLSVAVTDGIMPLGFRDPGARAGYTLGRLLGRSQKVANALIDSTPTAPWLRQALLQQLVDHDSAPQVRTSCRLLSVGGGPGFDYVALALLSDFFGLRGEGANVTLPVDALITDLEEEWRRDAACVARAVEATEGFRARLHSGGPRHSITFCTADITLPVAHHDNAAVAGALAVAASAPTVFVASYVVAENAVLLRARAFIFFRDLARLAPPGSLFLMTDYTHHMWPEVLMAAAIGFSQDPVYQPAAARHVAHLQVTFPRITRKRGYALAFRKPLPETGGAQAACPHDGHGTTASKACSVSMLDASESEHVKVLMEGTCVVEWLEQHIVALSAEDKRLLRLFQRDNQTLLHIRETPAALRQQQFEGSKNAKGCRKGGRIIETETHGE